MSSTTLLRIPEVAQRTGLKGKANIYRLMKEGRFPRPIKIGRISAWPEEVIEAWIQEQIAAGRDA